MNEGRRMDWMLCFGLSPSVVKVNWNIFDENDREIKKLVYSKMYHNHRDILS